MSRGLASYEEMPRVHIGYSHMRDSAMLNSAIFIGTLLRGNTYITELILHSNDLTPKGATFIVKQLSSSLKTLDIANIVEVEDLEAAKQVRVRRQSAQQDMLSAMRKKSVMLQKAPPGANKALEHATNLHDMEKVVHAVIRAQRGFRRFYATLEARRRRSAARQAYEYQSQRSTASSTGGGAASNNDDPFGSADPVVEV